MKKNLVLALGLFTALNLAACGRGYQGNWVGTIDVPMPQQNVGTAASIDIISGDVSGTMNQTGNSISGGTFTITPHSNGSAGGDNTFTIASGTVNGDSVTGVNIVLPQLQKQAPLCNYSNGTLTASGGWPTFVLRGSVSSASNPQACPVIKLTLAKQ